MGISMIIEEEIKRLRRGLSRSLMVIGMIAFGAIVAILFNNIRTSSNQLADISNIVSQESAVAAASSSTSLSSTTSLAAAQPQDITIGTASITTTTTTIPADENTEATTTAPGQPAVAAATSTLETAPTTTEIIAPSSAEEITPAPTTTFEFKNAEKAASSGIKTLPYNATLFGNGDGWESWWGNFSEASGTLSIGANSSTNGGGALLSGSGGWNSYAFQADVDWAQGESFGILSHFTSTADYIACEFNLLPSNDVHMYLDEYSGGVGTTLASADMPNFDPAVRSNISASIAIQGSQGTCTFNGHSLSNGPQGKPITVSGSGGVGFTTWDPNANNSQIIVKDVSVNNF